jgi:hypothetical protein
MSVTPSLPPGGPSLAEVLIQRTFQRPPNPFVDGDFIAALTEADRELGAAQRAEPAPTQPAPRIDVRV